MKVAFVHLELHALFSLTEYMLILGMKLPSGA